MPRRCSGSPAPGRCARRSRPSSSVLRNGAERGLNPPFNRSAGPWGSRAASCSSPRAPRSRGARMVPSSPSWRSSSGAIAPSCACARRENVPRERGEIDVKVAVLMGGRSSEREISLRTGRGIAQALRDLGHEVVAVDAANGRLLPAGEEERAALPTEALEPQGEVALSRPETLAGADVVLIALHGAAGENGTLQALLDL